MCSVNLIYSAVTLRLPIFSAERIREINRLITRKIGKVTVEQIDVSNRVCPWCKNRKVAVPYKGIPINIKIISNDSTYDIDRIGSLILPKKIDLVVDLCDLYCSYACAYAMFRCKSWEIFESRVGALKSEQILNFIYSLENGICLKANPNWKFLYINGGSMTEEEFYIPENSSANKNSRINSIITTFVNKQ